MSLLIFRYWSFPFKVEKHFLTCPYQKYFAVKIDIFIDVFVTKLFFSCLAFLLKIFLFSVLGIFEKLDVMLDPSNIEDCHWIKPSKGAKKVIVKLSRRKDANKIRLLKKGLKGMNLSSLGINSAVYINDSLCTYYKMLWGKCRKLLSNKYIHSFWVTNGTIKLKTVENGRVYAITHRNDLVELFPDNDILADQV